MNNLATKYAGKTETPDANYPTGGFKNETTPGLFDGTPFEKGWADDLNAFMQGLIKAAGITVSGTTDTVLASQILQGLTHQVMTADFFEDSGAADVYALDPLTDNYDPDSYEDGMRLRFIPDNTNTGASTANVSSIGAKAVQKNGAALVAGELTAGDTYELRYDLGGDVFEIVGSDSVIIGADVQAPVITEDGTVATGATLLPIDNSIPQITEGDEYITVTITPKKSTNKLIIDGIWHGAHSAGSGELAGALFQDATAGALKGFVAAKANQTNQLAQISVYHEMTAGTTSSTTFRLRVGTGIAGTTTFNGISGAVIFGGVMGSFLRVREVQV